MDIDTMKETDINLAVAKHVMQWKPDAYLHLWKSDEHNMRTTSRSVIPRTPCKFFLPSTDANATREMEAEIQRRGLADEYGTQLWEAMTSGGQYRGTGYIDDGEDAFLLATLSPIERCRAALRVVLGSET
jgi:hypothetical protein